MQLNTIHRKQIITAYCLIFYVLMVFKWLNDLFLYQLQPNIFNNRFDMFTWLVMSTGIHKWLLNNLLGAVAFDVAFYSMPLLLWATFNYKIRWSNFVAVIMLVVNFIYIQCYTLYPTNSIEGYIAWLLFPFLFMASNLKSYYFILHALRYFFLFFFASAALWKFYQGGIFNPDQMSAILLYQHKEFITSSPGYWYTDFIYWLINHPAASYIIYIAATLLELSFIAGFFTNKYDRILITLFVVFLITDLFFMRINYFEIFAFVLLLYYSRYTMPNHSDNRSYTALNS